MQADEEHIDEEIITTADHRVNDNTESGTTSSRGLEVCAPMQRRAVEIQEPVHAVMAPTCQEACTVDVKVDLVSSST